MEEKKKTKYLLSSEWNGEFKCIKFKANSLFGYGKWTELVVKKWTREIY